MDSASLRDSFFKAWVQICAMGSKHTFLAGLGMHFKHLAPWYTVRGQVQEAAHLEFRGVSPGAQSTEQGVATFQVSTQSLGFPIRKMSRELLPFLLHMGALP